MQDIDSGVSVKKAQWDDKRQKVKRHPLEEKLNSKLVSLIISVQELYYKNEGISAKRLLFLYKNKNKYDSSSFLDFYQQIVDETRLKGKIRTSNTQDKYITKLKQSAFSPVIATIIHTITKQMSVRNSRPFFLMMQEAPTLRLLNMHRILRP